MKKLLVVAVVMLVASMANAGMLISVDGVVNPPDSSVELLQSQTAIIDIHGDGLTPFGGFFLGVGVEGPGSLDATNAFVTYGGNQKFIGNGGDGDVAGYLGIQIPYVEMMFDDLREPGDSTPVIPLSGLLADGILFHCEGVGEVTLTLFDANGEVLDTQVIHQIPEPMTMSLLGLGALLIRRK